MDIQGADGHVYKGRIDSARLPNIPGTNHQGAPATKTLNQAATRPPSAQARSPRPGSARNARPVSSTKRPVSAQKITKTQVPTGQENNPAPQGSLEPPSD